MTRWNTADHSAGRVCYPSRPHAVRAIVSGRRGTYPGSGLTRAQWWPGKAPDPLTTWLPRPPRADRGSVEYR